MEGDTVSDKWIGFRQDTDGGTRAMFAMPSGRVREVPLDHKQMLDALADLARALKFAYPKETI